MCILLAGGTALRTVPPRGDLGLPAFEDVLFTLIALPNFQLFCLTGITLEPRMAACAMNAGVGSGVSVPFLEKMETLRRKWDGIVVESSEGVLPASGRYGA